MDNKPILLLALADIIGIVALGLLCYNGWQLAYRMDWAKVQVVNVYDFNHYMEELKMESIIRQGVSKGYFGLDAGVLTEKLADVSFVRTAKVIHSWPMAIDVHLEAHKPLAYFVYDDEKVKKVINNYAEYFTVDEYDGFIPLITAFKTSDDELNNQYRVLISKRLITWMEQLKEYENKNYLADDYFISGIKLTKSLSWKVELNSRIWVHLGQDNDVEVVVKRFNRFLAALERLELDFSREAKLLIDTRYTNSLAIKNLSAGVVEEGISN